MKKLSMHIFIILNSVLLIIYGLNLYEIYYDLENSYHDGWVYLTYIIVYNICLIIYYFSLKEYITQKKLLLFIILFQNLIAFIFKPLLIPIVGFLFNAILIICLIRLLYLGNQNQK
ncbi:hypothetical protein EMA8858_00346 [Emticicia aquatica]|uniref:Uncharacterized protein n=1 Tax=Emticicia aquatica TaxID=1681835 RepID=A0ABN8ETK8_9BACT|nr:hypothetical protein EMA8858_00346 [Emticicia aquatica]